MVLVDPASENRMFTMVNGKGVPIFSLSPEQRTSTIPPGPLEAPTVPHEIVVTHSEGARAALARLHEASAAKSRPLGDLPLVVRTRGESSDTDLQEAQAAIARLSTHSRHTIVAGAGHETLQACCRRRKRR
jgi:hypothetical protein